MKNKVINVRCTNEEFKTVQGLSPGNVSNGIRLLIKLLSILGIRKVKGMVNK